MTDDWSPPTGEHEQPHRDPADRTGPSLRPLDGDIEADLGVTAGELRIVDAFFHELALEAAADPRPPTPEEQEAVMHMRDRFERLKAMSPEEQDAERDRLLRLDR
jgi:hypothetical protein